MLPSSAWAVRAQQQPPVRGRISLSPLAPRRVVKFIFKRIPRVARFIMPPWQPRTGKVGSSFAIPVVNPIHGPPHPEKSGS